MLGWCIVNDGYKKNTQKYMCLKEIGPPTIRYPFLEDAKAKGKKHMS